MKTGIELIAEERQRQVEVEGWTPEHDDEHKLGELPAAAATYALRACAQCEEDDDIGGEQFWPFDWDWWKPSEKRLPNLVRAGALIAAEIDRIQRAGED
jgi:hypothetical protein